MLLWTKKPFDFINFIVKYKSISRYTRKMAVPCYKCRNGLCGGIMCMHVIKL